MCVTCSSDVDVVRSASTGKNMVFRASDELGCQDSNLEPSDPESDVLPIELRPIRLAGLNRRRGRLSRYRTVCGARVVPAYRSTGAGVGLDSVGHGQIVGQFCPEFGELTIDGRFWARRTAPDVIGPGRLAAWWIGAVCDWRILLAAAPSVWGGAVRYLFLFLRASSAARCRSLLLLAAIFNPTSRSVSPE